ncbi:MAG: hypothetical protein IMW85_07900 [Thermicanus sp.]|nr:hypothetical protein [Thermicanus sp.]
MRRMRTVLLMLFLFIFVLTGCFQIDGELDLTNVDKPLFTMTVLVDKNIVNQAEDQWKESLKEIEEKCKKTAGCRYQEVTQGDKKGFEVIRPINITNEKDATEDGLFSLAHEREKQGNQMKETYHITYHLNGYTGSQNDANFSMALLSSEGTFTVKLPKGAKEVETNGQYSQSEQKITWSVNTAGENTFELSFTHEQGNVGLWIAIGILVIFFIGLFIWLWRRGQKGVSNPPSGSSHSHLLL